MTSNKERFKELLGKIGSGENTSKSLTREESSEALRLILEGSASPIQIGAFMIAHRIRRPEPQELAGMIDTYKELGPKLTSKQNQITPISFGMPFDGRTKISPIYPLTTLLLLSAGKPVILQGGKRMPIKYGVTSEELFSSIGLSLKGLSRDELQAGFENHGLAMVYQPDHFPLADTLINYRDELGKRPPLASMELIWTAHQGDHLIISGFVHPPTEERAWKSLQILGENHIILVKGLEGSIDLPTSRTCITKHIKNNDNKRVILHPRDYSLFEKDVIWTNLQDWKKDALLALDNKGPLKTSLLWNAGTYFWFSGITKSIRDGLIEAERIITSGLAKKTLRNLISWRQSLSQEKLSEQKYI